MNQYQYKIGIVGPSRVGKTSLITALLEETRELLAGRTVSINPSNEGTKERIATHLNELEGGLAAGIFDTGAMPSNQEPFEFELAMASSNSRNLLRWSILDYPGGWIDSCPPEREKEWQECQAWIKDSFVLLIPIDATILMEAIDANQTDYLQLAYDLLKINQVNEVVHGWVKSRLAKNQSGLLILCPVKCETYFKDRDFIKNYSFRKDRSQELFNCIQNHYEKIIKTVSSEIEAARENRNNLDIQISIEYHPIDTIGTVALKKVHWQKRQENSKSESQKQKAELEYEAEYEVIQRKRNPLGGAGLLISMMKHLIIVERKQERSKKNILSRIISPVTTFLRWLTGVDKRLREAIEYMQNQPQGKRVRKIYSKD